MFKLTKIEGGRINVFEPLMYTVGTSAVVAGQALVLSDGVLVSTNGKPTFIALSAANPGEQVAVGRVETNQIYEVKNVPTVVEGGKYELSGGINITDTAIKSDKDGGAEVISYDATTDTALVRFVSNDRT